MMTLIVRNSQGASDVTKHDDRDDAADHIASTWHDPENLTAELRDSGGQVVYEGPAPGLPRNSTERWPCSDAEWSDAIAAPTQKGG